MRFLFSALILITSSSAFAGMALLGRGVVEPSGRYSIAFVCTGPETSILEKCSQVHLTLFDGETANRFYSKPLIMPRAPTEALFLKSSQNLLEFFYVDTVMRHGKDLNYDEKLMPFDIFKGFGFTNKDGYNWSSKPVVISKSRMVNLIKVMNHQGEFMTDIRVRRFRKLSLEQKELLEQGVCFPIVFSTYKGNISWRGSFFSSQPICQQ